MLVTSKVEEICSFSVVPAANFKRFNHFNFNFNHLNHFNFFSVKHVHCYRF